MKHEHTHHHPHHPHHHGPGRGHGRGPFDYGELRLLLLALIADQPRHGYDLIRSVEDRFGGAYVPSPGVIYPALSWLDDLGYVVRREEGGRKTYALTPEGAEFLKENRGAVDDLLSRRIERREGDGPHPAILRGMENLKTALKLRIRQGTLSAEAAEKIGAALDDVARMVEKSA